MAGALSMDDKLLGEKMHYYCSSSEDEEDPSETDSSTNMAAPPTSVTDFAGKASNTGPKGVINDWRRYKQLQAEKRSEQERELVELHKKLSITCRSHLDDEKEKADDEQLLGELEALDDEFMKEYRQKRLEEMRKLFRTVPTFESVHDLSSGEEFLNATENTHPMTTVIIHAYENNVGACQTMNACLDCLCKEYPHVNFCKVLAHKTLLSTKFSEEGVPALLVYRKGELVGNLLALKDLLGDDFFSDQVAQLLSSHGLLPPQTLPEQIIASQA